MCSELMNPKHARALLVAWLIFASTLFCSSGCEDSSCTSPAGLTIIPGHIQVTSQAELDALAGVVEIRGNLSVIDGSDQPRQYNITDLSPLSQLTSVGGELGIISNDSLRSLAGLPRVCTVGWKIRLMNNEALISLEGLAGFTGFDHLQIANNHALQSLAGLPELESLVSLRT